MRKWFMRQYWRLQQSQTIISMGFWVTTLTLLIWPYVSWRFEGDSPVLGLPATYVGLATIGLTVMLAVLAIGVIYDRGLGLWREQRTVDTERNPFGTYALIPAMTVLLGQVNTLLKRQAEGDEEVQATCAWVDDWLAWCATQEIWLRAQKHWDSELSQPVPDLTFLPHGAVQTARQRTNELDEF
jgi:hypothetical protein